MKNCGRKFSMFLVWLILVNSLALFIDNINVAIECRSFFTIKCLSYNEEKDKDSKHQHKVQILYKMWTHFIQTSCKRVCIYLIPDILDTLHVKYPVACSSSLKFVYHNHFRYQRQMSMTVISLNIVSPFQTLITSMVSWSVTFKGLIFLP